MALVGKKAANLQFAMLTDQTLSEVLELIDGSDADTWKSTGEENGFTVFRKSLKAGEKYACVKCRGVIDAAPHKVVELFADNTRTGEYNSLFHRGEDVELVADNTKVVWSCSTPLMGVMKARDFCTLVHLRKLKDGTVVVMHRAVEHPRVASGSRPNFVRGKIILAANIIEPVPNQKGKTYLTMITQMDPGGFAPPIIVNKVRQ
jgi:hypothetical protein